MRIKTNDKYISMMLKNFYLDFSEDIMLSAKLNRVYIDKVSNEIVNTKLSNQLNSLDVSICRVNRKFVEKSKNYEKVKEQMIQILNQYEKVLKKFCMNYDEQIEELILQKVEIELNLLMAMMTQNYLQYKDNNPEKKSVIDGINTVIEKLKGKVKKKEQLDVVLMNRLKDRKDIEMEFQNDTKFSVSCKEFKKQIKNLAQKIEALNQEKIEKVFSAMETEMKAISTEISKPRTFTKITRFFVNKFNTYKVITTTILEPFNQRIDEFKVNTLKEVNLDIVETDFSTFETKIKVMQKEILEKEENRLICEKIGI